jgi:hypothetical protein
MIRKIVLLGFVMILLYASPQCTKKAQTIDAVLDSISAESLAKNTQILSSDEFEGRAPASKGEELTINFIREEFQKLGLEPGNGDSFYQEVPMVEINSVPEGNLVIQAIAGTHEFSFGDEFTSVTLRTVDEVSLDSTEMVFVGYGIVAPEYDWNDYEDIDVRGKTVVMLVNDPGFVTEDPDFFTGRAMTYYGRWTYKYEEAARQGAAGAFIIHETEPAAYGWGVVQNGWTGPQFILPSEDKNMSRCAVEGCFKKNPGRSRSGF